ncbi:putative gustatory receptor 28b [Athalia rosae]|uniref:putative gustatory receptor 28b n=1 Tax=Athalia rosae TaxID=37344 RepID=UPI002034936B|nr:putative gustatory receptor 28b [Athalia rosae]
MIKHDFQTIYERHSFPRKLRKIATIHGALCEAASNINQAFSFNIVLEVIYAFSIMTCAAYYLIYDLKSTGLLWYSFNWGIIGSMDTLYMIWACSLAEHEAWLTGKIIHKLNVSETDTPLLNKVIQEFSLQLQYEKLEFTGAGLFRLDPTLIRSIAGTVTTYLIVLIQFNKP